MKETIRELFLTRVDQLLRGCFPSFLRGDLLFQFLDLYQSLVRGQRTDFRVSHTVSEGSASIVNFCCFRSWTLFSSSFHNTVKNLTLKLSFIFAPLDPESDGGLSKQITHLSSQFAVSRNNGSL